MVWDFSTDPAFEEQLAWMRRFVREEIWPLETLDLDLDQLDRALAPLREEVRSRGLWAAHLPLEHGGQAFGQVRLGLMHEILGSSFIAPQAFGNAAPDSGNSELLALAATPEQKRRYLDPLLAGEVRSGFSMTEPEVAGSDPTLLRARAVRDRDGWILNGHKWFTTHGSIASFLIVMAVTDPDAPPRERASMFVLAIDEPGVEIVRDVPSIEHPYERFGRLGGHAEIVYRDVRVRPENLLGREGQGFLLAQQRLGPGRIHHCMRWLGVSRRAFDALCERALSRESHGTLLADKQTVQNWIADSAAQMQAARLMTLHAAWTIDTQGVRAARKEISLIKFFGAQVLFDVVDRALQAHGALGFSSDMPLEEMYRFARGARFYDGPDEVHRATVARLVLRDYEPSDPPSDHVPTRREAARRKFAHLLDVAVGND